jgi:hypothetical protein
MATTTKLRSEISDLEAILANTKAKQADYLTNREYDKASALDKNIDSLNSQIASKNTELQNEYQSSGSTIKPSGNSLISTDTAELATLKKYQSAQVVGDTGQTLSAKSVFQNGTPRKLVSTNKSKSDSRLTTALAVAGVGFAAKKWISSRLSGSSNNKKNTQNVRASYINGKTQDLRVKIKVPQTYLNTVLFDGIPELTDNGGIIFPYTPSITFDQSAQYSTQTPLHSIFPVNFYQRSVLGNIVISGKFTVQNGVDAEIFLGTVHLLRSLTKMSWGGDNSGAPPPVCRLEAYGNFMFNDIPIAIQNFKFDLPESIDYFTFKDRYSDNESFVPVLSTFTITCIPMFSRDEMKKFTTDDFVRFYGSERKKGFI